MSAPATCPARAPRFDDLPGKMRALPMDDRGFPVPWFVLWRGGAPLFPVLDARKRSKAWGERLCWVCGQKLGRVQAFVIGPMCAVNRVSAEPPCHPECARFSARRCPFLANPRMGRVGDTYRGADLADKTAVAGDMITRNPGVTLVWLTLRPGVFSDGRGSYLFDIGNPHGVEWYAHGREATRAEVMESINTGLPILLEAVKADPDPEAAQWEFDQRVVAAMQLVPAEGATTKPSGGPGKTATRKAEDART